MTRSKLNLLVLTENPTISRVLTEVCAGSREVAFIGSAGNARTARAKAQQFSADLVLLDCRGSIEESVAFLEADERDTARVAAAIMSDSPGQELPSMAASPGDNPRLRLPIPKGNPDDMATFRRHLNIIVGQHRSRSRFRTMAVRPVLRTAPRLPELPMTQNSNRDPLHRAARLNSTTNGKKPEKRPRTIDVIAIGVSIGGPGALTELIPNLPHDLGVPILIVQHMPAAFTASLARNLDRMSSLTVREAEHGDFILSNNVYIAPGGRHMRVAMNPNTVPKYVVEITDDPPENSCRPAVDVLFRSLPKSYGDRILAIIMTGLGCDGLAGVRAVKSRGAMCLTQSSDTSVGNGMTQAVEQAGMSDETIPLNRLADRITSIVRSRRRP